MSVQSEKDSVCDTPLNESSEEELKDPSSGISSLYSLLMLMTYSAG
jgi:hypothetical protein